MFMQGRYGADELNFALIVISVILALVSRFWMPWYVKLVLSIISFALLAFAIFRTVSTNIPQRTKENNFFKPAIKAVTGFFKLNYKRLRDGKTHRYYKCPNCKAQLRVPNVKGEHTIRCPKCKYQFNKKIR